MNIISNTDHHEVKAAQVGFIMKAYRESFPTEAGRRGISQTALLQRMNALGPEHSPMTNGITSHATVSRWESGKALPTPERLRIFGKALDLSDAEIEGLILLASPDPQLRECRTLSCPRCGGETQATNTRQVQSTFGGKTETTSAIRTRQCSACGYSAESCERWSEDPEETTRRITQSILDLVQRVCEQLRRTLPEAENLQPRHPIGQRTREDELSSSEDNKNTS